MYPLGQKQDIAASVRSYYPKHYSFWFVYDIIVPNACVSRLTAWMISEFHSYVNL